MNTIEYVNYTFDKKIKKNRWQFLINILTIWPGFPTPVIYPKERKAYVHPKTYDGSVCTLLFVTPAQEKQPSRQYTILYRLCPVVIYLLQMIIRDKSHVFKVELITFFALVRRKWVGGSWWSHLGNWGSFGTVMGSGMVRWPKLAESDFFDGWYQSGMGRWENILFFFPGQCGMCIWGLKLL